MGFYFLIGLLYAIYNATKRNLDGKDDPLQVLAWIFAWPVYVILRIFQPKKSKKW